MSMVSTVKANHSLRFASGTINLLEGGLVSELNCQGNTQTTLQFAKQHGLCVLGKQILESFDPEGLEMRLMDYPQGDGTDSACATNSIAIYLVGRSFC